MPLDLTTIAIVLDQEFAEQLPSLARRVPVWVIDSRKNRPVIEALWTARRRDRTEYEIAIFREVPGLSIEAHLARIMRSAEGQQQLDPENPPFRAIEVFGLAPSEAVEASLRELGFGSIRPTPDGFRATATGERP